MIGTCPNCEIDLKKPPFENRNTNEVLITLKYRSFKDNNKLITSMEKAGYCEICDATLDMLEKQKKQE
jgi:hypothetical protein